MLTPTIKFIHESDIFGTIIEIGAGNPVSYQLFEVEGVSNTVYQALSPYNKQAQLDMLFDGHCENMPRSVSKEFINLVVKRHDEERARYGKLPDKYNMLFVSSFQIGDNVCNHGWIGYRYKDTYRLYHVTLPHWQRPDVFRILGTIGNKIIAKMNQDKATIPYCDILVRGETSDRAEAELPIQTLLNLENKEGVCDQILTFHRDGYMCRLETILREESTDTNSTIPIYKGSFNPPHKAHLEIAKLVSERFLHNTVFMISLDTHDKGSFSPKAVYRRIKVLNSLGYHVIVNRSGKYNDAITLIQERTDKKVVWIAGADTVNRLAEITNKLIRKESYRQQPVLTADFMVFKRPTVDMVENLPFGKIIIEDVVDEINISATSIREMLVDGTPDEEIEKWLSYNPNLLREER